MQQQLIETFAHKLRTPLHAVLGWAETLLLKHQAQPELKRALETIVRSARTQATIISDMLDTSNVLAETVRLNVQPASLLCVIEAAADSIRLSALTRRITLSTTLDPIAGPVSGDPQRLQQLVSSLLSNAVKLTPEGGQVEVRLRRVGAQIEITVRASANGSQAVMQPFQPIAQSGFSSVRMDRSQGLNLSVAKHLAQLHGGRMEALNAAEGQGTTFVVTLSALGPGNHAQREPASGERSLRPNGQLSGAASSRRQSARLRAKHRPRAIKAAEQP